jgi:hypothetical protein
MNRIGWSAATLVSALAGAAAVLFPACAGAEIYGWVDPSGGVTYSNLPPPKDARVIEVIPDEPPPSPQAQAAAHDAEMKTLNDRVRQLERELQASRMEAPPYPVSAPPYGSPPGYGPPPAYGAPPPYPSYDAGAGYGAGCDPGFFDCNLWDGPIYFTTGFAPWWAFRHHGFDGFHHGHHHAGEPGGAPHFARGPMLAHGVAGHGAVHASGYGGGHGGFAGGAGHAR